MKYRFEGTHIENNIDLEHVFYNLCIDVMKDANKCH